MDEVVKIVNDIKSGNIKPIYFLMGEEPYYIDKLSDYIEEKNGKFAAFEFKWNENKKVRFSKTFTNAYPDTECIAITPSNYEEFLMNVSK